MVHQQVSQLGRTYLTEYVADLRNNHNGARVGVRFDMATPRYIVGNQASCGLSDIPAEHGYVLSGALRC